MKWNNVSWGDDILERPPRGSTTLDEDAAEGEAIDGRHRDRRLRWQRVLKPSSNVARGRALYGPPVQPATCVIVLCRRNVRRSEGLHRIDRGANCLRGLYSDDLGYFYPFFVFQRPGKFRIIIVSHWSMVSAGQ